MNNPFLGTGIAIVTPYNQDGSVDHEALKKIVNFNVENGTNYIVISGTTGESVTITKQEKKEIIKTVKEANANRLPLVLGIGGNNTAAVIEEINATDLSDFAGILSVSPYYSKPTQEGMYQHFKAIAEACPIPIILYNVPGRTAKNMDPATVLRLANDFENIVAVKEAGNNLQQYYELLRDKPEDFSIISGDDDLALGVVLAGGAGVISVIGQAFPKEFSKMIQLGLEGKAKEAYNIHYKLMEIVGLIFSENNPAGIKAVLKTLDLCSDKVRLPLVEASSELKNKIESFVSAFYKS
ncbi:4-hydroxy-tetrahydrodipicolinate synthase [Mesoflavibacter sabulilitoris]|uniref:4-hydroxy-tetrahydrodipicolinate synthase n=1 Tax=Mesoflavibacter zeaxanthinifaciens subsp. sabulilitoris TaxID=1520893 RepID=A0A2T1NHE3_9FLAO|nr:4-hydroxy-tetrahydrodipicolinate synthase [Mesoflavibacter zeaxanthinifaciens]MBB3122700.1 4-hydroxy-tetrahydrodipicolinate synthase [Mesoflavibacter zeaxanthinifaciens subsp. sabulilitoris]PSG92212.1 4-hydroxy-tetrahydrodipicolinate synthase [Mesoflavibacter zeaxanthinifaciens subsp. sabulilitoris]